MTLNAMSALHVQDGPSPAHMLCLKTGNNVEVLAGQWVAPPGTRRGTVRTAGWLLSGRLGSGLQCHFHE